MSVTHLFVSALPDGADATLVRPSNWNEAHVVSIDNADVAAGAGIVESKLSLNFPTHAAVTIGTANGLSLVGQAVSLGLASAGVTGALSGTDWTAFNSKQSALTFPLAASLGGTGIANGASATLTLPNAATTISTFGATLIDDADAATALATLGAQAALTFPLSPSLGGTGVDNGTNALTVPATGTAALLATANVFTALNTFNVSASASAPSSKIGFNLDYVVPPNNNSLTLALVSDGGAGNLSIGTYRYFVSYVTAEGETEISGGYLYSGTAIVTDATHKQVTVTVPVSSDSRVTGRKIYRSTVNGAQTTAALLTTINDNSTASYQDNIADASLGAIGFYRANTTNKALLINSSPGINLDANVITLGAGAGAGITSGGQLILIGWQAGNLLKTETNSIVIGRQAYAQQATALATSLQNVFIGDFVANAFNGGGDEGNVAIGHNAMRGAASGSAKSVAIGVGANQSVNGGFFNVIIGYQAANSGTSLNSSVILGYQAGFRQTTAGNLFIVDNVARASTTVEAQNCYLYGSMTANGYLQLNIPTTTNNAVREAYKAQAYVSTGSTGAANGFGVGYSWYAETATDATYQQQGAINTAWIDATNATRKAKMSLSAYDTAARLGIEIEASGSSAKLGFYGATPVTQPTTYTQTYSTASKTNPTATAANLSTTAATQTTPWGFATQAQADDIATQVNKMQTDYINLQKLVNAIIDDLQALGLAA